MVHPFETWDMIEPDVLAEQLKTRPLDQIVGEHKPGLRINFYAAELLLHPSQEPGKLDLAAWGKPWRGTDFTTGVTMAAAGHVADAAFGRALGQRTALELRTGTSPHFPAMLSLKGLSVEQATACLSQYAQTFVNDKTYTDRLAQERAAKLAAVENAFKA